MQAKSLSVICPIYNESMYIASFIESILVQDYPKDDMEIILVDGMSTDDTRATVLNFAKNYDFIKFLENPDKIVSHALNNGIKASVGKFIIILIGNTPPILLSRIKRDSLSHLKIVKMILQMLL